MKQVSLSSGRILVGRIMTRFAKLRRIECAIELKDEGELRWALAYCRSRLSISKLQQHRKHWQSLIDRVQAALDDAGQEE
jgi:hypothetical protein